MVIILTLANLILFWSICWITKGNILRQNLKKVQAPDDLTFLQQACIYIGLLLLNALFSWINVLLIPLEMIKMLLNVLREALASTPEEIKLLRFPLWNNPHMSREFVWAHYQALNVKALGIRPNADNLNDSLNELVDYYPSFRKKEAINELKKLIASEIGLSFDEDMLIAEKYSVWESNDEYF